MKEREKGEEGNRLPSKKTQLINEVEEDVEVGRLLVPSTSRPPTPPPHQLDVLLPSVSLSSPQPAPRQNKNPPPSTIKPYRSSGPFYT